MGLLSRTATVTTTGGAGTSAGAATINLPSLCKVYAIQLDYTGEPATTDVTITDDYGANILVVSNNATDGVYYPRRAASKAADGTASTLSEVQTLTAKIQINVAQGDNNGTVAVTVVAEEVVE